MGNLSLSDCLSLDPDRFLHQIEGPTFFLEVFRALDAFWMHSGDPKQPHVELISGKCSNGYFNCPQVLKYINLSTIFANQLALKLAREPDYSGADWCVTSAYAGIEFGRDLARVLGIPVSAFTEKDPTDPTGKTMMWKRNVIPPGATVLRVEDLITTGHTTEEVERAIRVGNPYPVDGFLKVLPVIVYRPPTIETHLDGKKIVSLIAQEGIWAVPQNECELCKAGSKRVRPKQHWEELIAA